MPAPTLKTGMRIEGIEKWEKAVSPEVFRKTLKKGITDATIHLEGELIENTPTNKSSGAGTPRGRLAAAWTHVIQGVGRVTKGIIGNNVFYGPFVNFGTGTWVGNSRIRAKSAKALRFVINGMVMFRKSVSGIKPRMFVQKTVRANRKEVTAIIADRIQKEWDEL